jgi:hypothetical protein
MPSRTGPFQPALRDRFCLNLLIYLHEKPVTSWSTIWPVGSNRGTALCRPPKEMAPAEPGGICPTEPDWRRLCARQTPTDLSLIARARTAADQGHLDTRDGHQAVGSFANFIVTGQHPVVAGSSVRARDALQRRLPDRIMRSRLQLAIVYQGLGDDSHATRYRRRAKPHHRKTGSSW